MVVIKVDPNIKIYILTKVECSRVRNVATRDLESKQIKSLGTKMAITQSVLIVPTKFLDMF